MSFKFLTAAACLFVAGAALAQPANLEVKDAWARATPGQATTGVAYLTIVSPTADRLTAISSPAAKKAELHTMSMTGDIMQMRAIDGVDVPAGKPVSLKPGGTHIMLIGLNQPLRAGQSFPLTLTFAKAGPREVKVAVTGPGAMSMPGMSMPQH